MFFSCYTVHASVSLVYHSKNGVTGARWKVEKQLSMWSAQINKYAKRSFQFIEWGLSGVVLE